MSKPGKIVGLIGLIVYLFYSISNLYEYYISMKNDLNYFTFTLLIIFLIAYAAFFAIELYKYNENKPINRVILIIIIAYSVLVVISPLFTRLPNYLIMSKLGYINLYLSMYLNPTFLLGFISSILIIISSVLMLKKERIAKELNKVQ